VVDISKPNRPKEAGGFSQSTKLAPHANPPGLFSAAMAEKQEEEKGGLEQGARLKDQPVASPPGEVSKAVADLDGHRLL